MVYPGMKYRNDKEMEVSGTIHFNGAYSEGFDFILPKGETFKISVFTDPDDDHIQVWLENPDKYEEQIAGEYLNSPKYDSYSLLLKRTDIESYCESDFDFSEAIYFYSSKEIYGEFSNFSEHGFAYQEKYYPSVEHFYQSQKFSDSEYSEKIRQASSPKLASELGKSRNIKLKDNWDEIKDDIMTLAVRLKFDNNPQILTSLLATRDKLLIENSPYDKYWGIGQDGTGYNQLGTLLMRVRKILKHHRNKT